ncbi:MAG: imidazole glycerol phosphate synthase subunit HisH [Clostridiales bacterium]|jgi:glutamine amidotransferase|nr:imidazole glycerol phosphate synthase subunit HisH [Clostridiales bacterium]
MTAIVDYGVGNLFSLRRSLDFIGAQNAVTNDPAVILKADRIILPGVGAFGDAAKKLAEGGFFPLLRERAASGVPILGICLGMQLLFDESEEFGRHEGLGLISGRVCPLKASLDALGLSYKLPQMGWNALHFVKADAPLLKYSRAGAFVYYVHSHYATEVKDSLVAFSEYGVRVPGIVQAGSVMGCQFHPEKSGDAGLAILRAFVEYQP